jgi:DNA-binding NarL/FixJ family response regulator
MQPLINQEPSSRFLCVGLITGNHVIRTGLHMILGTDPLISKIVDIPVGVQARAIVVREKPQVIIVDLELSDADPTAVIRELRMASTDTRILVLSGLNDSKSTVDALSAGAEGVVLNVQPPAVLIAAIVSLSGFALGSMGDRSAQSADCLNRDMPSAGSKDHKPPASIENLTTREREIIVLIAKGLRNKGIADRLCVSDTTVRHHLTSIYSKLQVSSRQQLLIVAHKQGLDERAAG